MLVCDGGDLASAGVRYTRMPPGRFLVRRRHVVVARVTHGRFGVVGIVIGRAVVVVIVMRGQIHVLVALVLSTKFYEVTKKCALSKLTTGLLWLFPCW